MPLKILFADDSMTAQNMGKKILTEAGYEVVAVSNGAAAVKKIAEHKPDIIILDIYMPGYSGLEVCEKVRASIDTLKTPVLLTVGKMEPYKPEDANRVKADGVIIKPFEASDLLAIVKKLEERIVPPAIPPLVQQTIRLERPPDFAEFAVHSTGNSAPGGVATVARPAHDYLDENTVQPTVDVPDHMATVSAFSDLLGTDTIAPVEFSAPIANQHTVEIASTTPSQDPSSTFTSIPEFEADSSMASGQESAPSPQEWQPSVHSHSQFAATPEPETAWLPESTVAPESAEVDSVEVSEVPAAEDEVAVPESSAPASVGGDHEEFRPDGVYPDTQPIPVYVEPEAAAAHIHQDQYSGRLNAESHLDEVELEPTATAPTEDFLVQRDPGFEPTQAETDSETMAEIRHRVEPDLEPTIQRQPDISPVADPNLVTDRAALESFPTTFGVENPEEMPVGIASEFTEHETAPIGHQAFAETEHIENLDVEARSETSSALASADDDFEARVAAAMNVYAEPTDLPTEAAPAESARVEEPQDSYSVKAGSAPAAAPEDDFEARVAAALALYEEPQQATASTEETDRRLSREAGDAAIPVELETEPQAESQTESLSPYRAGIHTEPPAVEDETPVSFEYSPPVRGTHTHAEHGAPAPYPETTPAFQAEALAPEAEAWVRAKPEPAIEENLEDAPTLQSEAYAEKAHRLHPDQLAETAQDEEAIHRYITPREAAPQVHAPTYEPASDVGYVSASNASTSGASQAATEQITASIEAEMPVEAVAAAAVATGADSDAIAQVVHRVMERLKPELIAAIVRELNSQK